jgi:hypothetical protein
MAKETHDKSLPLGKSACREVLILGWAMVMHYDTQYV